MNKNRPEWANTSPIMKKYYDQHWGLPEHNDNQLFKWLTMELFQSGLSWLTILKRESSFDKAFDSFEISKVANYTDVDFKRLMNDTGIIRNSRKIKATINNAKIIKEMQDNGKSFDHYVWSFTDFKSQKLQLNGQALPAQTTESFQMSKQMKHDGFQFVGPKTIYSFMTAIGLVDARL